MSLNALLNNAQALAKRLHTPYGKREKQTITIARHLDDLLGFT